MNKRSESWTVEQFSHNIATFSDEPFFYVDPSAYHSVGNLFSYTATPPKDFQLGWSGKQTTVEENPKRRERKKTKIIKSGLQAYGLKQNTGAKLLNGITISNQQLKEFMFVLVYVERLLCCVVFAECSCKRLEKEDCVATVEVLWLYFVIISLINW